MSIIYARMFRRVFTYKKYIMKSPTFSAFEQVHTHANSCTLYNRTFNCKRRKRRVTLQRAVVVFIISPVLRTCAPPRSDAFFHGSV